MKWTFTKDAPVADLSHWITHHTGAGPYFAETAALAIVLLMVCLSIIIISSVLRWAWEWIKYPADTLSDNLLFQNLVLNNE